MKIIKSYKKFFLFTLLLTSTFSTKSLALQKKCLDQKSQNLIVIESINHGSPASLLERKAIMKSRNLKVYKKFSKDAQFIKKEIASGDCLKYRESEVFKGFEVTFESESSPQKLNLQPALLWQEKTQQRSFVLVPEKILKQLASSPLDESKTEDIWNHNIPKDLTVLYVSCSENRLEVCEITIKHQGEWLKTQDGKIEKFLALGLSRKRPEGSNSQRLNRHQDSPQGLYTFWASIHSNSLNHGGLPRIDLDAQQKPILAGNYFENRYLLEKLLPKSAWDDYWANEWALAYHFGRSEIRFHGNQIKNKNKSTYMTPSQKGPYLPNRGCFNTGTIEDNTRFLKTLKEIGVVQDNLFEKPVDDSTVWKVSPKLGKVFVIVKDKL